MSTELPSIVIDRLVRIALEEDLGGGDVTTEACIDDEARSTAHAVARRAQIACGARVAERVFMLVDAAVEFHPGPNDGVRVDETTTLWSVRGRARSILMAERVALNFVQRMAGVATLTRRYVDAVPAGSKTRITDTRKTTPGLRALERFAVRTGGGKNHRDNLGSAVLIKDNHIAASGGIAEAIARARSRAPHTSKIECEVDTLQGLEVAIGAGADIVMLDNMSNEDISRAVGIAAGRVFLEASGGITLERIPALAQTGVDAISVGALTHSAAAMDIGLDFE
ncbi:MAG: carboxylating nicotinate-nucleotide diphosphorylase [Polyangiaceae bacterium]|nr:carboxylating nicotinate-nucleotide diphosphorylase [Polyangiaceae bacterium]